jgi:CRISPR/Cas system-associated exonuclease Cas4 (RecB family)
MGLTKIPRYLGTNTLGHMKWCHQNFIFKSIYHESEYRLLAVKLEKIPGGIEYIPLNVRQQEIEYIQLHGSELQGMSIEEVNQRLSTIGLKLGPTTGDFTKWGIKTFIPVMGNTMLGIYPKEAQIDEILEEAEYELWKRECKRKVFTIYPDGALAEGFEPTSKSSDFTNDMVEGIKEEVELAEKYGSAQGRFEYDKFIIVCAPDGITDEFCYEFKSTRNHFLEKFIKPVAITQANLYSYFFNKPEIRVQIHIRETGEIVTIEKPIDASKAESDLQTAVKLLRGEMVPIPPKSWKCKRCEYREKCPINNFTQGGNLG